MTDPALHILLGALEDEGRALVAARAVAERGAAVLASLSTGDVQAWAEEQGAALQSLRVASLARRERLRACLPADARSDAGGALGDRLALNAVVASAPGPLAAALGAARDRARSARDELALHVARNEVLARDVLAFTEALPHQKPAAPTAYTAAGRPADEGRPGPELLRVSV